MKSLKLILSVIFLLLGLATNARAQTTGPLTISASSTDCVTANSCVALNPRNDNGAIRFTVAGTHNDTLVPEFYDGTNWYTLTIFNLVSGGSYGAAVTSLTTTTVGNWVAPNMSYQRVRLRSSSHSSGSATVTITAAAPSFISSMAFGGGSATIGTVNQGTASATEQWLVNCATGCSSTSDTSATLQAAATGNGNGSTLSTAGMSSVTMTVNCATCSGGTLVNFEASEDSTNYTAISGLRLGTTTLANTVSTAGLTYWQFAVGSQQLIRARVSAYSAGTVTVTAHASAGKGMSLSAAASTTPVSQSGAWSITDVSGTVSLPTGASTSANQTVTQAPITPASATATKSDIIGVQYNSTPTTFTNGQQGSAAATAHGVLLVNPADSTGAPLSLTADVTSDCDTGGGTQTCVGYGILLPASGGAVYGGTSTNPVIVNGVVSGSGTATSAMRVELPTNGTGVVGLNAGTNLIGQAAIVATATVTNAATPYFLTSAASTNSTSVKGSAGNIYNYHLINTTATLYYLRMYNAASAPTCSSATNFVKSIPIPASTTGDGIVVPIDVGEAYSTGIAFCLTGGGSSTDNTNAATGVYINIDYK